MNACLNWLLTQLGNFGIRSTRRTSLHLLFSLLAGNSLAALTAGAGLAQTGEIKIGGLAFITGQYSSYGADIEKGMKLAVNKINADGGVLGKKIVLDLQDTASDPSQAVSLLRRFAAASDVVAVVGPTGTPELLGIMPVAKQLSIPIVVLGSNKTMDRSEFPEGMFRVSLMQTPETVKNYLQKVSAAKNIKRLGLFVDGSSDSSQAEAKSVREAIKLNPGVELAADDTYRGGDKNFSVLIAKMMRANVDAMWLSGQLNENVIIIPQARSLGFKGVIMGGAPMTDPRIVQITGTAASPYVIMTPLDLGSDSPAVKDFVDAFKKNFGTSQIATFAAYSYDATMILCDAIKRAGTPDRKAIADAFGTTKDFKGVTGDYSFLGKGDNTSPRPYVMEVKDGAFVTMK